MDYRFFLIQLFMKVAAMRKAQKDYYAYKGDPKTDPLKQAYLQEAQRREQDLDALMVKLPQLVPELTPASLTRG